MLDRSIHGGELFQSIVFNPVSVISTIPNFGEFISVEFFKLLD